MHETSEPGPAAQRPASALEAFFAWPLAAATLVGQANLRLFESLMSPAKQGPPRASPFPWTTANTVALELASMRLRNFSTGTDGPATLICAPYALHGATIADFAPGHSVVETLCQSGLSRVFVTDWRSATPETRYFTIDNHLADLNVAVDELGPPVDLIGLCQGGWLALVYAARFPKKVRRLVLVGAPIDIAAAEFLCLILFRCCRLACSTNWCGRGRVSCMAIECSASGGIAWLGSGRGGFAKSRRCRPRAATRIDRSFSTMVCRDDRLAGSFYLQVVNWLFKQNQIAQGRFVALGQCIDLAQLRTPICLLAASHDEVVSRDQLFAVARLVGTPADQLVKMTEPGGHLGLFLGADVLGGSWREIAYWLRQDLSEPQISNL